MAPGCMKVRGGALGRGGPLAGGRAGSSRVGQQAGARCSRAGGRRARAQRGARSWGTPGAFPGVALAPAQPEAYPAGSQSGASAVGGLRCRAAASGRGSSRAAASLLTGAAAIRQPSDSMAVMVPLSAALTLSPAAGRAAHVAACLPERSCMCWRRADRCLLPIATGGGGAGGYGGGGGFGGSRYGDGGCAGHCSAGLEAGAGRRLGSSCAHGGRVAASQATDACMPCAHHQQNLILRMQLRRWRWPVRRRWWRLGRRRRRRWPVRGAAVCSCGLGGLAVHAQAAVAASAHALLQPTAQLCCHGSPIYCGGG